MLSVHCDMALGAAAAGAYLCPHPLVLGLIERIEAGSQRGNRFGHINLNPLDLSPDRLSLLIASGAEIRGTDLGHPSARTSKNSPCIASNFRLHISHDAVGPADCKG